MTKPYQHQWRVLTILFLAWGIGGLARNSIAYLFPYFSLEFNLGSEHTGFLASTVAFFWAVSIMLCGRLVDKWGQPKVMIPGMAIGALFLAAFGLSQSVVMLYGFAALFGLFLGSFCAPSLSMIAEQSDPKNRGLFIGVMQSGFTLIGAAVGSVVITKLGETMGWRSSYFIMAAVVVLLVIIMVFSIGKIKRPSLSDHDQQAVKASYGQVLKYKNVKIATVLTCLTMMWFFTVSAFAIVYLIEAKGYSPVAAGAIFAGFGLGGFLGEATVPAISDNIGRKLTLIICSMVSLLAYGAFLFLDVSSMVLTVLLFVSAYFFAGMMPISVSVIPSESVSEQLVPTATALTPAVGEMMGGVVSPSLGGICIGFIGVAGVMKVLLIAPILIMIGALALSETAPRVLARKG